MTGQGLINGALRLIGVLAEGESPSSDTTNDAFSALNDLLDSWSNESLIAFPTIRETLSFSTAGLKQTYTWGTGGDLNSARPVHVDDNILIQLGATSPAIELPMNVLNQDQYASITLKTLTSKFPLHIYIDNSYPLRNINVWPVPTDSTNSLVLYSQKPLTSAALNTALSLPPGYLRALRFNFAVDLAPEFGRPVPAEVMEIAVTSKAAIKRNNKDPVFLTVESALRAQPAVYNWRTDGYQR